MNRETLNSIHRHILSQVQELQRTHAPATASAEVVNQIRVMSFWLSELRGFLDQPVLQYHCSKTGEISTQNLKYMDGEFVVLKK